MDIPVASQTRPGDRDAGGRYGRVPASRTPAKSWGAATAGRHLERGMATDSGDQSRRWMSLWGRVRQHAWCGSSRAWDPSAAGRDRAPDPGCTAVIRGAIRRTTGCCGTAVERRFRMTETSLELRSATPSTASQRLLSMTVQVRIHGLRRVAVIGAQRQSGNPSGVTPWGKRHAGRWHVRVGITILIASY